MLDLDFTRGSVEPHELPLLERLTREAVTRAPGPVVEIGTLIGVTTRRLAHWSGRLVCTVDNYSWNPWDLSPIAHLDLATLVLEPCVRDGTVSMHVCDKTAFMPEKEPALVFLDAVHTYTETMKDIEWARRVGAVIVCGHDYSPRYPGVIRAVQEAGGPRELLGSVWSLR